MAASKADVDAALTAQTTQFNASIATLATAMASAITLVGNDVQEVLNKLAAGGDIDLTAELQQINANTQQIAAAAASAAQQVTAASQKIDTQVNPSPVSVSPNPVPVTVTPSPATVASNEVKSNTPPFS